MVPLLQVGVRQLKVASINSPFFNVRERLGVRETKVHQVSRETRSVVIMALPNRLHASVSNIRSK